MASSRVQEQGLSIMRCRCSCDFVHNKSLSGKEELFCRSLLETVLRTNSSDAEYHFDWMVAQTPGRYMYEWHMQVKATEEGFDIPGQRMTSWQSERWVNDVQR